MTVWPVQHAKARFSELLDTCQREGPQVVSRRGCEAAVLVPIDEWRRLQAAARPSLKDLLLSPGARSEMLVPPRGQARRRSVPAL
ncbi:type II toxin-antitoxin system Phd/YefM family antitoxin [Cyanobium sp. Alchichica 3B3-8F6]|uniref:type II toxin-antitoxin system Phd/YefM family antitoxin n=1 Tax=Synechococcales TaxID=1890424 RepID=UPI000B998A1C|nr:MULTISPECIES: type II toxin-antitoxin system Phd/YefM family antitoxin [Synechococcales]MCP9882056.1 type II toxin-antitoxin system Phd/YefM family antitoxin [Cyanobium sp. Alchichica 3B3-8F6]MCP9943498.1 type II toxin-antitoxin system Phd/YefM family antitoxin [Cyanobium sp. ATX 6E8]